jgi:hypothetical protein
METGVEKFRGRVLYCVPQRSVSRFTKFPMPLELQIALETSTLSTKKQDINIHNYPPNK